MITVYTCSASTFIVSEYAASQQNSPVLFVDEEGVPLDGDVSVITNGQKKHVTFIPQNPVIEEILLNNVVPEPSPPPFRLHTFSASELLPDAVQMFSFDPAQVEFQNGEVTVIAVGDTLEKCANWDFATQTCVGTWAPYMVGLTPGQAYTFIISPVDPGFKETVSVCDAEIDENTSNTFISACDATDGSNLELND